MPDLWRLVTRYSGDAICQTMPKVVEVNLERGLPTVDAAIQSMKDALVTCKRRGARVVILIHGYGSSGVGGGIRTAVRRTLGESSMRGLVASYAFGEQWHYRKKELLSLCRELAEYEGRISNNEGVTVVILK
jgi:hypothetical protein